MPSIIDKLKAEERNERTIRLWPDVTWGPSHGDSPRVR